MAYLGDHADDEPFLFNLIILDRLVVLEDLA